ncbi:MAG: VOC family protein [Phycisphaerales bacterium]|nr:VOC family protein [Phycisphaerales bacterium]
MITGVHALIYSPDAEKARAFFRDVLGLRHVDAGEGWLIFALPPAELGVHPEEGDEKGRHELFLMCDDVHKTVDELKAKGVEFTRPISDQGWGLLTTLRMPGGRELGLYQPRHQTAI